MLDAILDLYRKGGGWRKTVAHLALKLGPLVSARGRTLAKVLDSVPRRSAGARYDAVALYSGGKDSSYMLLNLSQRGLKVCAWMLQQGYQSPTALENAGRLCRRIGVDLEIEEPGRSHMDSLFRLGFGLGKDSAPELVRAAMTYGSACWPCFAVIAARAAAFCEACRVPLCFIGTQKGQNRMDLNGKPALAGQGLPELDFLIDKFMKPFREYAGRHSPAAAAAVLERPTCRTVLIPFYEFVRKPPPEQQIAVLGRAGWKMSRNTGMCSTNCMINELGRKVMRTRFGFDLYQIIEANEKRLCPDGTVSGAPQGQSELDHEAVRHGAKMINLTESEAREFGVEV